MFTHLGFTELYNGVKYVKIIVKFCYYKLTVDVFLYRCLLQFRFFLSVKILNTKKYLKRVCEKYTRLRKFLKQLYTQTHCINDIKYFIDFVNNYDSINMTIIIAVIIKIF